MSISDPVIRMAPGVNPKVGMHSSLVYTVNPIQWSSHSILVFGFIVLSSVPSSDSRWPDSTARSHRSLSHNHKGNTTPGSIHHSKPALSFLRGPMVCCHTLQLKQMAAAMHVRLQSRGWFIQKEKVQTDFTCSTYTEIVFNRLYKLLMRDFKSFTLFNLNANRLP